MIRNMVAVTTALVLLGASGAAMAGPYVAASGTLSQFDYEDVDDAYGGYFAVGYRVDDSPLFVEIGYIDSGDAQIDRLPGATANLTLRYDGLLGSLGWFHRSSELGSGVWVKGTLYDIDTEAMALRGSIPGEPTLEGTIQESGSGVGFAFGGVWKVSRLVGIRGELGALFGLKDFANDEAVTVASLGVELGFGGGRPVPPATDRVATEPAPPRPTPAPEPQPAAAVPQAEPAPAPATPTPAPAPATAPKTPPRSASPALTPLGVATVQSTQVLRDQPRPSAASRDGAVSAGVEVEVLSRIYNRDGHWAYVRVGDRVGWLPQATLGTP